MRRLFPALAAFGLVATLALAHADETPRTVSDYAVAMGAAAARLDVQVTQRQKLGDMAAAQRLVLAAAMVRRTAEEFRGAEQEAMADPVASLPAPIPERAEAAYARVVEAETRAADRSDYVDEAHVAFNALLSALPYRNPHPVFFGLLSGDLTGEGAPLGHDVVIYGFRLIDSLTKTAPVVLYGKTEISGAQVADDRIEVTLPDAVKQAVHFAPSPCDPRPSFGLRVRETYGERHGVWPIAWITQVLTNTDLFTLPTPVIYSAAVSASAESTAANRQTVKFSQKSGLSTADCGQSQKAEVVVPLPESAADAACTAAWVDASGASRTVARCVVEGHSAHAIGEIVGGGRVCSPDQLCACLSVAQGWLEASGSYSVQDAARQVEVEADFPSISFPAGGAVQSRIVPSDGQKLRHIALAIARRDCPTPVDSLELTLGDGAEASEVSKTGAFRASLRGGELTLGAADALAESAAHAP